jgi:hypothetical protein
MFYDFNAYRRRQQLAAISQSGQAKILINRQAFISIRTKLANLNKTMARLNSTLERIGPMRFKSRASSSGTTGANATSASELSDLGPATATVMTSTEQVNTTPTSFSPFGPAWIGSSTAQATIDGIYDGSNGSMTLTFEVNKGGTHGVDHVRIKVFDAYSQEIDEIFIDKNDPIDMQYTLSNGLIFTLGDGDLTKGDTFSVDVYASVGSVVDPAKPLNGTRNDNPNLEYGLSVTDGSFDLNGTAIDVYASDTINAVLDRITQSAAGVSATFDAATEKIVLTQKTLGSVPTIAFSNDTSGFLAATKLDTATPTPGTDDEKEMPLTDVTGFSSVQSGYININGVDIAIDVDADSLNDVLDLINASGAGVTASFDDTEQRVTIISNDSGQKIILDSGVTGFFPALEISDGTYQPTRGSGGFKGMPQWYAFQFAHAVRDVAEALNALFDEPESGAGLDAFLKQLRRKIQTAVQKSFDSDESHFETDFGVKFDFRDTKKSFFDFSEEDLNRLASSLIHNNHVRDIRNLFLGKYNLKGNGLVTRLTETLKNADSDLEMTLEGRGSLIDVWA